MVGVCLVAQFAVNCLLVGSNCWLFALCFVFLFCGFCVCVCWYWIVVTGCWLLGFGGFSILML